MRVLLSGVSCVGKTTIGLKLAGLLGCPFFDLDREIEEFLGVSIERLQSRFLTMHSFRDEAAEVLARLLAAPEGQNCVVALPPSGLMGGYWRVVKKQSGTIIVLTDTPENILQRITFYDIDSHLVQKWLTPQEKVLHLREIRKDITYFRKSYEKADLHVDISGCDTDRAAAKLYTALRGSCGECTCEV